MRMGFLPGRANQGGGSSAPDGTLPQYTSMTALAAALTVVGSKAELIGATTGALIGTYQRDVAGDNGLRPIDARQYWQADGTEFDGDFAPVSVNSAGTISWGVAGDRATGGITVTSGTVRFPGMRRFVGEGRIIQGVVCIDALTTTPAAGHCLLVGCLPAASTTTDLYGGGIGHSGTGWRSCASANGAPDAPGLGYGGTSTTTVGVGRTILVAAKASTATAGGAMWGQWVQGNDSGVPYSVTYLAATDSDVTTFEEAFTIIGAGWDARIIEVLNASTYEVTA